MKLFNIIQNRKLLKKFGRVYISYFGGVIEPTFFKVRNLVWGKPFDFFNVVCIETTSICNRRCSYCPNSKYYRGNFHMDTKIINKILKELKELDYRGTFCFHLFNEPLIDKRLPEIIKETRKEFPMNKIVIYSNGDLLTIGLFKKLIKNGVTHFDITQHAKEMTKPMKEIFRFIDKNPEFKKNLYYKTQILLNNWGGLVKIEEENPKINTCHSPTNMLAINYKGDVIICCINFLGNHKYGNVKDEKIIDIWNKKEYKNIRKECRKGIFNLPLCKKCANVGGKDE